MNIVKYTVEYSDLVKDFRCGNEVIDKFLRDGSALDENQGITYILLSDESDFIIGYYNIEVGRVDQIETIGNKEYYKPMGGAVNINYLAIHSDFQGMMIAKVGDKKIYLGDFLLRDCEKRILDIITEIVMMILKMT